MMKPDVDIIVVAYNSAHVIDDLLDSIPAAFGAITANVIVVDNGSTDDTVQVLKARGDCHIVLSDNVGYAGGINRGVKEGSGADALFILNPDVRLHEGSVAPLLAALREPGTGIVTPRILSDKGELEFSLRREPTLLRAFGLVRAGLSVLSEYVQEPEAYEHPHVVDWAVGAVLMMSRTCFDALGGWDESFFLYSEETDLMLRARDIGLATRYEPRSVAVHIGGASGRSEITHAIYILNRVRLYRRRHGAVAAWLYYVATIGSQLSWMARGFTPARFGLVALLRPSRRPPQANCSSEVIPR